MRYKECRNSVINELRKARKTFESKRAADIKSDPKYFYRQAYVRSKTKSKDSQGRI